MTVIAPTDQHRPRATFPQAVHAEWAKFWGLRSTTYTLGAYVLLALGLIVPVSYGAADEYRQASPAEQAGFVPAEVSMLSLQAAMLPLLVLGVLVVTGEYATGAIRSSLAAVPRRHWLLAAKAVVFAAVTIVISTVTGVATFLVSQRILATSAGVPHATLGDPQVLRAVLGIGLFMTAIGLLAVAAGALVRATAGGIASMVVLVAILPSLTQLLPDGLAELVQRYYPTLAGSQLVQVVSDPAELGPWRGFAVLAGFLAAALAVAFVLLRRRDA
ncbi:ABC transporter permease subunit [Natronosporangium hydrolyticum]|uniref:ABC transporter permease subunit n=1 Tax=Natronosporangium hydrolyticum TaxID=2811111 RepID=A0A895Y510_9ACTN|nr:ABC transporter permease subunit [Natronosporangium hydrolyticum]QSB12777.1 ABC transporter permease subunit [Natronosporangium hydrolyticum]